MPLVVIATGRWQASDDARTVKRRQKLRSTTTQQRKHFDEEHSLPLPRPIEIAIAVGDENYLDCAEAGNSRRAS